MRCRDLRGCLIAEAARQIGIVPAEPDERREVVGEVASLPCYACRARNQAARQTGFPLIPTRRSGDQAGQVQSDIARGVLPSPIERGTVGNRCLVLPRHQGRGLQRLGRCRAQLGDLGEDLLPARAERHHHVPGDACRLEVAVLGPVADLVAERFDRLPEGRHRHRVEQGVERPELVVAERPPAARWQLGDVGHYRVNVGLRFLSAAGVVLEKADQEVAGQHQLFASTYLDAGLSSVLLRPVQGRFDGVGKGLDDALIAADQR